MTLTITINDAVATTVVDNVCKATNYNAASGQTKAQWAKAQVIDHIKRLNKAGAMKVAQESQAASEAQIT